MIFMKAKPAKTIQKSMLVECPECGERISLVEHLKKLTNFGDVIISTLSCGKCGFRLTDVMPAEFHEPRAFETRIESPRDLNTKVVRSSSGTIEIPELGVKIEPGPRAEGYITNIEGVLDRVQEVTELALQQRESDESDESKLARKELQLIKDARDAKVHFRFIIVDPFGNSALLGPKVKSIKLTQEQIMLLKKETIIYDLT